MKHGDHTHMQKTKKQVFEEILERARVLHQLPTTFSMPYSTVLSRIRRNNLYASGNDSPLAPLESKIVDLILCMSKLKRSLTCSDGLRLINELIEGTVYQDKLIEWKKIKK